MSNPALGFVLLLFGLPCAVFPYRMARFEEQMDSIGSRRSWSAVEPAEWKVGVTRISGIVMAVVGAFFLLSTVV